MSLAARALLFAVRVYQAFFSALMPSACKFYPSCSHYAAEALQIHGARRGVWLALGRVSRCHPFTRGGVDLVPGHQENLSEAGRGAGFTGCGKTPHTFCHSERSEESLFPFMGVKLGEILRSAQNDKIIYFFRNLFSLRIFIPAKSQKPQAEAYATEPRAADCLAKEVRS